MIFLFVYSRIFRVLKYNENIAHFSNSNKLLFIQTLSLFAGSSFFYNANKFQLISRKYQNWNINNPNIFLRKLVLNSLTFPRSSNKKAHLIFDLFFISNFLLSNLILVNFLDIFHASFVFGFMENPWNRL